MFIGESVDYHFQVVVVLLVLLLDVLDGAFDSHDFIVFFTDVDEFAVDSFCEFVFCEEKLAVVEGLVMLYF